MRLHQTSLIVGFALFWLSVQFLGALAGPIPACLAGLILGLLATYAARFFSLLERPVWLLPILLGSCSLFGLLLALLVHSFAPLAWFAVPLATLSGGMIVLLQTMSRRRCGLCTRRLSPTALTFTCPRCALVVCDESCWSFEHRRCQLCVEHRVPLLSDQKQWWDRVLGPSSNQGRCQVCMAACDQSDLRPCGRCRRLQCRACWDNLNGECARCGWTIPDLPPSLRQITSSYIDPASQHQHE